MTIRKALKEDINNGLLDIFIEGYRYHCTGRPDVFSNKSDEALHKDLENMVPSDNILVIEDDGKIVGYIVYEIRDKHAKTLWVDQLVVSKESRGKGYGKELMNKIDEIAKSEDCVRVELECWSFNENALGMYEHLGFGEQRVKLEKKVR